MRLLLIYIFIILLPLNLAGQNLLGYKAGQIEKFISKNKKELVKDENSRNEYYEYLKYTDGTAGTSTYYFFLSDDGRCERIKSMHVHAMKDVIEGELDSMYTRTGTSRWTDRNKGIDAVIKLVSEEWFFTVTIEPDKKE
jgi:hypothetical protein